MRPEAIPPSSKGTPSRGLGDGFPYESVFGLTAVALILILNWMLR